MVLLTLNSIWGVGNSTAAQAAQSDTQLKKKVGNWVFKIFFSVYQLGVWIQHQKKILMRFSPYGLMGP